MIAAFTALLCLPMIAEGQQAPSRVPYVPSCRTCAIELTKLATIGSPDDSVLMRGLIARDGQGRFHAVAHDGFSMLVYDRQGRLVKSVGRQGQGPGEFGGRLGILNFTIGNGDTLFVATQGRMSVFDANHTFVRSWNLNTSGILELHQLTDGNFLVGGIFSGPRYRGYSIHVLDRTGAIVRSLGDTGRFDPRFVLQPDRRAIWLASDYRIRELRLDGTTGRAVDVIGAPWFAPQRETTFTGRGGRAPVKVMIGGGSRAATGMTADGILWIAASKPPESGTGPSTYGLQAFDTRSMRMLAVIETPAWIAVRPNGEAYSVNKDADGVITYTLWGLRLRR